MPHPYRHALASLTIEILASHCPVGSQWYPAGPRDNFPDGAVTPRIEYGDGRCGEFKRFGQPGSGWYLLI